MISFLLRYGKRTRKTDALAMAEKTLEAMSMGGIYDHLGSGFHRYSTDARWLVPHFEKMLYDQALLAIAYTEAYQMTKRPWYRTVAMECLAYLVRDLQSASGGFFSAVDADSEGSEGKFYLWSADELEEVLGDDTNHFARAYNVSGKGNFREQGDASPSGKNILYRSASLKNLAKSAGMQESEYAEYLAGLRMKLLRKTGNPCKAGNRRQNSHRLERPCNFGFFPCVSGLFRREVSYNCQKNFRFPAPHHGRQKRRTDA